MTQNHTEISNDDEIDCILCIIFQNSFSHCWTWKLLLFQRSHSQRGAIFIVKYCCKRREEACHGDQSCLSQTPRVHAILGRWPAITQNKYLVKYSILAASVWGISNRCCSSTRLHLYSKEIRQNSPHWKISWR